jgi:rhamnosyltransferase
VNRDLDENGGFEPVLSNEDSTATARQLHSGARVAYVADAQVSHSLRYGFLDEFRRSFDAGYVRSLYSDVLRNVTDVSRGISYGRHLVRRIVGRPLLALPYAVVNLGTRYLGYQMGAQAHKWPVGLKIMLSKQSYYWTSDFYADASHHVA